MQEKPPQPPHHPALLKALAKELQCEPGDIVDFELNVCDTVPGTIGGQNACWHAPPKTMLHCMLHSDLFFPTSLCRVL